MVFVPGALYRMAAPHSSGYRWRCVDYSGTGKGIPLVRLAEVKFCEDFDTDWEMVTRLVAMEPDDEDSATVAILAARLVEQARD